VKDLQKSVLLTASSLRRNGDMAADEGIHSDQIRGQRERGFSQECAVIGQGGTALN